MIDESEVFNDPGHENVLPVMTAVLHRTSIAACVQVAVHIAAHDDAYLAYVLALAA